MTGMITASLKEVAGVRIALPILNLFAEPHYFRCVREAVAKPQTKIVHHKYCTGLALTCKLRLSANRIRYARDERN
jgi:hypothetical protein